MKKVLPIILLSAIFIGLFQVAGHAQNCITNPKPEITPSFISACKAERGEGQSDEHEVCHIVCDSSYVTYTTPLNPGSSYVWEVQGSSQFDTAVNELEVFWTGSGEGTVIVTETDSNGCTGTTQICIEIAPKPEADFIVDQPFDGQNYQACLDQEITFNNLSSPGQGSPLHSFTWDFGDGNIQQVTVPSSDENSVTHSYNAPGIYEVMLITENRCYCKDTAYATIEVSALPGPDITCISTTCPETPQTYQTSADCPDYNWSVTNGTIISGAGTNTVTVEWDNTSPGILTLDVDGCDGDMCDAPTSIQVPVITPTVNIIGPQEICQYNCHTYRIDCSIPVSEINWSIPSGATVQGDTVNTHSIRVCYNDTLSGNIEVNYNHHLPGSSPELSCGGSASIPVTVLPRMYITGPHPSCVNDTFAYNIFPDDAGQIKWSLTDDNGNIIDSSTTSGPQHSYQGNWNWGAGSFTVMAEDLSGIYCNSPAEHSFTVSESPDPPDSISGPDAVCPAGLYQYAASPSSQGYYIEWEVVNGSPSNATGNTVNVTWDSNGPYAIDAFQTNAQTGCRSSATSMSVENILPLQPTVIDGPDSICANYEYIYSSPDPGDEFIWHIYPPEAGSIIQGQYTNEVTLQTNQYEGAAWIITSRFVCDSARTDSTEIYISDPPAPVVSGPAEICQDAPFTFTASAAGATNFTWEFGDGNVDTGSTVNHIYDQPGNYVVVITAHYTQMCSVSVSETHTIGVNPAPASTISTPDPNLFCQLPVSTTMYITSPVTDNTYEWFDGNNPVGTGSSYTANDPGNYFAIAENTYGCVDTSNVIIVDTINCGPGCSPEAHTVSFDRDRLGCNTDSFTANLSNAGSPDWNFDDPHTTPSVATGMTATHTFTEPGYYRVNLCANVPEQNSTDSCRVCYEEIDTINYIPEFHDSLYCADNSGDFNVKLINTTKALSTAPVPTWSWSVDNNPPFSNAKNPTISLSPGTYEITLNVDGVCELTKTIVIPVVPQASFTVMDSVCVGTPVSFDNTSSGTGLSATWTFGDGSSSQISDPQRTYSAAGTYSAGLLIENAWGCSDSTGLTLDVLPNTLEDSLVTSGPSQFCAGQDSMSLSAQISGGYPSYEYQWSSGETTQNIFATATGSYYADIIDQTGCRVRTEKVQVNEYYTPDPVIIGPDKICQGTFGSFFYTNYPAGSGFSFQWILDGVMQSMSNTYYPGSLSPGTYELVLEVSSPDTCTGTDTTNFEVTGSPHLMITADGSLCEGDNNLLIASSNTPGIEQFYWNTGHTNDTLQTSVPDNYSVTVRDSNGCEATTSMSVNPLPEMCGLMTGCYEICDTVSSLSWYAPTGYSSYTWFYNGDTIQGQTGHELNVPVGQSGTYEVYIETAAGCGKMSDPIYLDFFTCGKCEVEADGKLDCGPVDEDGTQTYDLTLTINNTLDSGAQVAIYPDYGSLSNVTPATLNTGSNTVTATLSGMPQDSTDICFTIQLSDGQEKCEQSICLSIPDCDDCEMEIYGLCAHCESMEGDLVNYSIEFTINSPFNNADVSVTPVTPGNYGNVSPSNIGPGMQNITFPYSTPYPADSILCFEVTLEDNNSSQICEQEICVALPDCRDVSIRHTTTIDEMGLSVTPNPARDFINIESQDRDAQSALTVKAFSATGRLMGEFNLGLESSSVIDTREWAEGVYILHISRSEHEPASMTRVIIRR